MELSMFEIALLAWCFIATSCWLDARRDARVAKHLLFEFIENPEAREQFIKVHKQVGEAMKRNATN